MNYLNIICLIAEENIFDNSNFIIGPAEEYLLLNWTIIKTVLHNEQIVHSDCTHFLQCYFFTFGPTFAQQWGFLLAALALEDSTHFFQLGEFVEPIQFTFLNCLLFTVRSQQYLRFWGSGDGKFIHIKYPSSTHIISSIGCIFRGNWNILFLCANCEFWPWRFL